MYINNQFHASIYQPNFQSQKVSISKLQKELASGLKMDEIAKRNNISISTIYNRIKQFDLPSPRKLNVQKIKDAISLLEEGQLSQKEISKKTGLSKYLIAQIITKYLTISPHKKRLEALKEMLHLPLSNKEVAQRLNTNINNVKSMRYKLKLGNRDNKKIECLKQILKLKQNNETNTAIAKKLNISRSTVLRLLKAYKNNEILI